jgi:hypothetical protein
LQNSAAWATVIHCAGVIVETSGFRLMFCPSGNLTHRIESRNPLALHSAPFRFSRDSAKDFLA